MEYPSMIEIGVIPHSKIFKSATIYDVKMIKGLWKWKLQIVVSDGKRIPKDITKATNLAKTQLYYSSYTSCMADYEMLVKLSEYNLHKHATTFVDENVPVMKYKHSV